MSQRNIEIARAGYDALERRDFDAFAALCDPQVELTPILAAVEGATYRGHEGIRAWGREIEEYDIRVTPLGFLDFGDSVIVSARARMRAGGADVEQEITTIGTFHDRKIVSIRSYRSREEALEALGRSG